MPEYKKNFRVVKKITSTAAVRLISQVEGKTLVLDGYWTGTRNYLSWGASMIPCPDVEER